MDLEAELLALAGEEDEDDLKIESSPQRPIPSSPKKRQRAPPAKRSRKKPRRDDNSDGDDDDDVKDEQ